MRSQVLLQSFETAICDEISMVAWWEGEAPAEPICISSLLPSGLAGVALPNSSSTIQENYFHEVL
jgi:hypothetical protein